jgi:hypothetical protein
VLLCSLGPLGCLSTVLLRCRPVVLLRSPRAACRWRCFCCCPVALLCFPPRLLVLVNGAVALPRAQLLRSDARASCCGAVAPSGCCVVGKAWCLVTDYALQLMTRAGALPRGQTCSCHVRGHHVVAAAQSCCAIVLGRFHDARPVLAACFSIMSWQQPQAMAVAVVVSASGSARAMTWRHSFAASI